MRVFLDQGGYMNSLASHMAYFLRDYLEKQRGASQHTSDTYSYSFKLLFKFASKQLKIAPSSMTVEQLDATLITKFLEDLEVNNHNTAVTRNVRLAAVKSFFHFLEFREPAALDQARRIFAIPFKKTESRLVPYLNIEETQALLKAPDLSTRSGIRDYAIIQLMLASGLRVSELTGLNIDDLILQPTASILIHGKGRKERSLPLWKETAAGLRRWLSVRNNTQVPELFINSKGEQLTRWGIAHILKNQVKIASLKCPSLIQKQVSPHTMRHTCAMVVLQATKDIRKVALWLGHESTKTTEVYVRADPSEKLEAIKTITPIKYRQGHFRAPDKLIESLKG